MALTRTGCIDCKKPLVPYGLPVGEECPVIETRSGGVGNIVVAECSVDIDLENMEEVQKAIENGLLIITGCVLGSKPVGTPVKKKLCSCRGEETTDVDRILNFTDYNADCETFSIYKFWDNVDCNQRYYKFGFLTCKCEFRGWLANTSLFVDDDIPEDVKDCVSIQGELSWSSRKMNIPISWEALPYLAG